MQNYSKFLIKNFQWVQKEFNIIYDLGFLAFAMIKK